MCVCVWLALHVFGLRTTSLPIFEREFIFEVYHLRYFTSYKFSKLIATTITGSVESVAAILSPSVMTMRGQAKTKMARQMPTQEDIIKATTWHNFQLRICLTLITRQATPWSRRHHLYDNMDSRRLEYTIILLGTTTNSCSAFIQLWNLSLCAKLPSALRESDTVKNLKSHD